MIEQKENHKPVSRILYSINRVAIIYLGPASLQGSSCQPTNASLAGTGASSAHPIAIGTLAYLAFQHARFTRDPCCHEKPWALTPHFHLSPDKSR